MIGFVVRFDLEPIGSESHLFAAEQQQAKRCLRNLFEGDLKNGLDSRDLVFRLGTISIRFANKMFEGRLCRKTRVETSELGLVNVQFLLTKIKASSKGEP